MYKDEFLEDPRPPDPQIPTPRSPEPPDPQIPTRRGGGNHKRTAKKGALGARNLPEILFEIFHKSEKIDFDTEAR